MFQAVTLVFHLGGTTAHLVDCCPVDDLFLSVEEKVQHALAAHACILTGMLQPASCSALTAEQS